MNIMELADEYAALFAVHGRRSGDTISLMTTGEHPRTAIAAAVEALEARLRHVMDTNVKVIRHNAELVAENERLREALSGMLTHMGMDEDEWNKPTFDAARAALETKT
jgi:hypothetical protein